MVPIALDDENPVEAARARGTIHIVQVVEEAPSARCRKGRALANRVVRECASMVQVVRALPRVFWLFFAINVCAGYAYFGTAFQITTYFHTSLGQPLATSAEIYGSYGIASLIWMLVLGPLSDSVGVRYILLAGSVAALVGRILFALTPIWLPVVTAYISLLVVLSFGDGAIFLSLRILAAKHVSEQGDARKIGYSLLYSAANIGALFAGINRDLAFNLYTSLPLVVQTTLPRINLVFALAAAFSAVAFFLCIATVVCLYRCGDGHGIYNRIDREETEEETKESKWQVCWHLIRSPHLWRFLAFSILTVGAKGVFRQLDVVVPIVAVRSFGEDAWIGTLSAVDEVAIIFFAPLAALLTARFDAMRCMILGTWLMVLSQEFMAVATPEALGLWAIALFGVVLATGEALFGPRLDHYASQVAGDKHLGLFMSIVSPLPFIAKFPSAWFSGWAMTHFCHDKSVANETVSSSPNSSLLPSAVVSSAASLAPTAWWASTNFANASSTVTLPTPSDGGVGAVAPCDVLGLWSTITVVTILISPFLLSIFRPWLADARAEDAGMEGQRRLRKHRHTRSSSLSHGDRHGDDDDDDEAQQLGTRDASRRPEARDHRPLSSSSSSSSSSYDKDDPRKGAHRRSSSREHKRHSSRDKRPEERVVVKETKSRRSSRAGVVPASMPSSAIVLGSARTSRANSLSARLPTVVPPVSIASSSLPDVSPLTSALPLLSPTLPAFFPPLPPPPPFATTPSWMEETLEEEMTRSSEASRIASFLLREVSSSPSSVRSRGQSELGTVFSHPPPAPRRLVLQSKSPPPADSGAEAVRSASASSSSISTPPTPPSHPFVKSVDATSDESDDAGSHASTSTSPRSPRPTVAIRSRREMTKGSSSSRSKEKSRQDKVSTTPPLPDNAERKSSRRKSSRSSFPMRQESKSMTTMIQRTHSDDYYTNWDLELAALDRILSGEEIVSPVAASKVRRAPSVQTSLALVSRDLTALKKK